MSEKDVRKAALEKDVEFYGKLENMRTRITTIFEKYHRLGMALERLLVDIDRMMEDYDKEIKDGSAKTPSNTSK